MRIIIWSHWFAIICNLLTLLLFCTSAFFKLFFFKLWNSSCTFFFSRKNTFRVFVKQHSCFCSLPASPFCPVDATHDHESSSCFQILPGELSWTDARKQCLNRGGDLAIVRSDKLRNLLATKVTQWVFTLSASFTNWNRKIISVNLFPQELMYLCIVTKGTLRAGVAVQPGHIRICFVSSNNFFFL